MPDPTLNLGQALGLLSGLEGRRGGRRSRRGRTENGCGDPWGTPQSMAPGTPPGRPMCGPPGGVEMRPVEMRHNAMEHWP